MTSSMLIGSGIFVSSLVTCFLVFFISFNFFPLLTRNLDLYKQIRSNNLSVSVLTGGFIVSVSAIINTAARYLFKLFQMGTTDKQFLEILLDNGSRAVIMFTMAMFLSFLVNWFTMKSFSIVTTGIDDMKELKNNNLTVSIVLTTLLLSTTYMVIEPIATMSSAFVVIQESVEYGMVSPFIDFDTFITGTIGLLIMLTTSIFLFFIGLRIMSIAIKGVNEFTEFKKDNIAISLIVSASIISVIIMVKQSIGGAAKEIAVVLSDPLKNGDIFISIVRYIYFMVASSLFSIFVLWLSMGIFILLTKMFDSINEIKNRNISTALILSVLTVSASFIMRTGIQQLIDTIKFF